MTGKLGFHRLVFVITVYFSALPDFACAMHRMWIRFVELITIGCNSESGGICIFSALFKDEVWRNETRANRDDALIKNCSITRDVFVLVVCAEVIFVSR